MDNDIFTRDTNNNAAVRTVSVSRSAPESNSPIIFTTDDNGNACVRVTGNGGGGAVDSVNGKTGNVVLDASDVNAVPQYETMPTASADELGNICQFIGTTDANYTNGYFYKCVSDGALTPTYSWEAVEVQASSGGLPSQTGNSGKFLTTDGTDASWSDKPLVNTATGTNSLTIQGTAVATNQNSVNIGYGSSVDAMGVYDKQTTIIGVNSSGGSNVVSIGYNATSTTDSVSIGHRATANNNSIAVGKGASASGNQSISIGKNAVATGNCSIQLGYGGTNSDNNTFKVANNNGNFQLMSADGTIPADRISPITSVSTSTLTQELASQYIYDCVEMTSLDISFPATLSANYISQVNFSSGATPTTLSAPAGTVWRGSDVDSNGFTPVANKRYSILFFSDGVNVCGLVQGA